MFVLCLMKETVRVIPELFDRDEEDTLKFLLEEKYSNKVIIDIGLGISVFEIKEVLNRYLIYAMLYFVYIFYHVLFYLFFLFYENISL